MAFKDHFSGHAANYAVFRPKYPAELTQKLASLAPGRQLAWDCGTGNGQAATLLAEHFELVVATDPSRQQLLSATPRERIAYVAAAAEHAPLADRCVDLITVAQALHWFDFDRFYAEVRRVGRRGAILAAWGYELARISPEVDCWVNHYYRQVVGQFWPPERRYLEEGYRTVPFPFVEIEPPACSMHAEWGLGDLLGYLSTWSATQRASRELGFDILAQSANDATGPVPSLPAAWGRAERRRVTWPLSLRIGRID